MRTQYRLAAPRKTNRPDQEDRYLSGLPFAEKKYQRRLRTLIARDIV